MSSEKVVESKYYLPTIDPIHFIGVPNMCKTEHAYTISVLYCEDKCTEEDVGYGPPQIRQVLISLVDSGTICY